MFTKLGKLQTICRPCSLSITINDLVVSYSKSDLQPDVLHQSLHHKFVFFDLLQAAILYTRPMIFAIYIKCQPNHHLPQRCTFHLPLHICHLESMHYLCWHPTQFTMLVQAQTPTKNSLSVITLYYRFIFPTHYTITG